MARAVWVVFDPNHRCLHAVLLALEVNEAIAALVTATLLNDGEFALAVTATRLVQGAKQALLR